MSKQRKISILMLFALVLIAAVPFARNLVPTAGSKISIPPGAFIPTHEGVIYSNNGIWLRGLGNFTAPVYLPGSKTVTKVILYAIDNSANNICANLYLTNPINATENIMGQICSSGAQSGLRTFEISAINPANVGPSNALYLWLSSTENSANLLFYGVKIFYEN